MRKLIYFDRIDLANDYRENYEKILSRIVHASASANGQYVSVFRAPINSDGVHQMETAESMAMRCVK